MMNEEVTLASLPSTASWEFITKELAVLSEENKPVAIVVHGAVKDANLFKRRGELLPTIELTLWSANDAERASQMFTSSLPGE